MILNLLKTERLDHLNDGVVNRVLVLLQPSSDVVGHNTGVVRDGEVGVLVSLGLGLQENWQFAKGCLELLLERLVSGLGEEGLLLQDGPDAHGLLKHDDGGSQVHAEVDHDPVNAFLHIFLLLSDEPRIEDVQSNYFINSAKFCCKNFLVFVFLTCDG